MARRSPLTVINSGGVLTNAVLYPYPVNVHAIHAAHATGSTGWLLVFDSATVPPDGTVPLMAHAIESTASDAVVETVGPIFFENGIYVCESDTLATKTLHAGQDMFIHVIIEEIQHDRRDL